MVELNNTQKKDWALSVYTREGLNQKETALKVGVSAKTMCKWVEDGKWETLKASTTISKEENLRRTYAQINELNDAILRKPEGKRYADSKEADTLVKLSTAAKALESDASISEMISTFIIFLNWLKTTDLVMAQQISKLFDEFIKSRLK